MNVKTWFPSTFDALKLQNCSLRLIFGSDSKAQLLHRGFLTFAFLWLPAKITLYLLSWWSPSRRKFSKQTHFTIDFASLLFFLRENPTGWHGFSGLLKGPSKVLVHRFGPLLTLLQLGDPQCVNNFFLTRTGTAGRAQSCSPWSRAGWCCSFVRIEADSRVKDGRLDENVTKCMRPERRMNQWKRIRDTRKKVGNEN